MTDTTDNKKVAMGATAILTPLALGVGSIAEQLEASGQTLILGILILPVIALTIVSAHFFIHSGSATPRAVNGKSNS